jgi:hypothetical protein
MIRKRRANQVRLESAAGRTGRRENYPLHCDLTCRFAGFAPPAAVGACRRDQAVYCTAFSALNNKNSLCLGRKQ